MPRENTAYHEAGHAFVALDVGLWPIASASIGPSRDRQGRVTHSPGIVAELVAVAGAFRQAVTSQGSEASRTWSRAIVALADSYGVASDDVLEALDTDWPNGVAERQILVFLAGLAAERLIAPDTPVEEGTAEDYHHTTEWAEARHGPDLASDYLRWCELQVTRIVQRGVPAIEALASALLERDQLTSADVEQVCYAAVSAQIKAERRG